MPTFKKTVIIDARRFTGGMENAHELLAWVTTGDVAIDESSWTQFIVTPKDQPDREVLCFNRREALIGDWIVKDEDGSFSVLRDAHLKELGFTQV